MIELKLAEYDLKSRKFLRFYSFGKSKYSFFYGGDTLLIQHYSEILAAEFHVNKDEKDPLKRFNGLFDGRTYGEGRFVLIERNYDDLYQKVSKYGDEFRTMELGERANNLNLFVTFHHKGNLHENPELFDIIE